MKEITQLLLTITIWIGLFLLSPMISVMYLFIGISVLLTHEIARETSHESGSNLHSESAFDFSIILTLTRDFCRMLWWPWYLKRFNLREHVPAFALAAFIIGCLITAFYYKGATTELPEFYGEFYTHFLSEPVGKVELSYEQKKELQQRIDNGLKLSDQIWLKGKLAEQCSPDYKYTKFNEFYEIVISGVFSFLVPVFGQLEGVSRLQDSFNWQCE